MIINVSLSRVYYIVNQITQPVHKRMEIHKGGRVLFNKRNNMMCVRSKVISFTVTLCVRARARAPALIAL